MNHYYSDRLSGTRLQHCYAVASKRVQRYLDAEIQHADERLAASGVVLELGCGYGRIARRLARPRRRIVGVDRALGSLTLARQLAAPGESCSWLCMDALALGFADARFDAVVCLQNGVCAFCADPVTLLAEALRVTRPGGMVLLSSYAEEFWPHRLAWFEAQAEAGLLGRLDRAASRDGVIVCADGFRSGTMTPAAFRTLAARFGLAARVAVEDASSVFCELRRS